MKKLNYKAITLASLVFLTASYSCKKVLDKSPAGVLLGSTLARKYGQGPSTSGVLGTTIQLDSGGARSKGDAEHSRTS